MTNYYSPKEIADYCGVHPSAVSAWIRRDQIEAPAIESVNGLVRLWTEEQVEKAKTAFQSRKPRGLYYSSREAKA
jgi:DNA-binding transcriptional MerR regulator